jgi:hypothetical protein
LVDWLIDQDQSASSIASDANDDSGDGNDTQPPSILEFNAKSIATQLTHDCSVLWKQITPHQLVNQNWSRNNKHITAPTIVKIIQRYNHLAQWVAESIVNLQSPEQHIQAIEHAIDILTVCQAGSGGATTNNNTLAGIASTDINSGWLIDWNVPHNRSLYRFRMSTMQWLS